MLCRTLCLPAHSVCGHYGKRSRFQGIWLLAAPFVIGYSDTGAAVANDIIVGVIVLILAAWSAYASRDVRPAA